MKNIVSILLVVLLVLAVGCGNAEVAEDTQEMEEKEDLENTAEVMVKDDDVEVKVKVEDDLVKADTTVKTVEDVNLEGLDEWCEKGKVWKYGSAEGSVDVVFEGIVEFKGQDYCKGLHTLEVQGLTVKTTYYTAIGGKDIWVISDVAGQTVENHVTLD